MDTTSFSCVFFFIICCLLAASRAQLITDHATTIADLSFSSEEKTRKEK